MICQKHPASEQAGGICPQCEAKMTSQLVWGFIALLLTLFIVGSMARGAELPKALTPEEKLTLSELIRDALVADRDFTKAYAAYLEAQKKQETAVATFLKAKEEAGKKIGCELDDKFACLPKTKEVTKK